MYKNNTSIVRIHPRLFKCLLIMKFISFFIFGLFIQTQANVFAQKINISVSKAELTDVLNIVQKQTDLDFLFNSSELKNVGKIDLHMSNADLKQVLDQCLSPRGLVYAVQNKTVLIRKAPELGNALSIKDTQQLLLEGKVLDSDMNPVVGASVKVVNSNAATATREDGSFSLSVIQREGQVIITAMGYEDKTISYVTGQQIEVVLNPCER
ncbi:secretin/TonB-like protein [Sphingobacterium alimentarium]|uniref:Secretin/TonB-like protein n=2 Tax=Sphingobacterium alimentarium TaxID=797292 RepID=A0A4R3VFD1_9SPHI|nr:secretin/TonB-like protein [Sphingobacterium alimentarium]